MDTKTMQPMKTIKDAKEAVAGQTLSPEMVKELDEAARILREPTDKSLPQQAAYYRAYSVWLIEGGTTWPNHEKYGLTEELSQVLRRQCRALHHKELNAKRPAVFFTEAEARKAAEDLRYVASYCCELGDDVGERICRELAQKFDTWRKE